MFQTCIFFIMAITVLLHVQGCMHKKYLFILNIIHFVHKLVFNNVKTKCASFCHAEIFMTFFLINIKANYF